MLIQRLVIQNFRNLQHVELDPVPGFNLICGPNGAGKTSVLEAIYYLALGRSFRLASNQYLVQQGQSTLSLFAQVQEELNAQSVQTTIGMSRTRGEDLMIKVNFDPLARLIDLIDHICVQVIHPQGIELITKESEGRRSFIDWGVYYSDPSFKQLWWDYRKALKQRNALLRQTTTRHQRRRSMLLEPFYAAPAQPSVQVSEQASAQFPAQSKSQSLAPSQDQTQLQTQAQAMAQVASQYSVQAPAQTQLQSPALVQPPVPPQAQNQAQAQIASMSPQNAYDFAGQPHTLSPVLQRAMDNALNGEATERLETFNFADYGAQAGSGLGSIKLQADYGQLSVNPGMTGQNLGGNFTAAQPQVIENPWGIEQVSLEEQNAALQSTAWNLSVVNSSSAAAPSSFTAQATAPADQSASSDQFAQPIQPPLQIQPEQAIQPIHPMQLGNHSTNFAGVANPTNPAHVHAEQTIGAQLNAPTSGASGVVPAALGLNSTLEHSQIPSPSQSQGVTSARSSTQGFNAANGNTVSEDASKVAPTVNDTSAMNQDQELRARMQRMWSNPVSEFTIWNEQIAELSEKITQKRLDYLKNLQLVLQDIIEQFLPNFKLKFELYFGWDKGLDLRSQLAQNLEKERGLGYTLYGCHRADLKIKNHNLAAGATLSRGQLKMLVYAMRLAQGMLLKQQTQRSCIYLIDDLNSELDENSQRRLLNTLLECQHQVFISNIQSDFRNTLIPHGRSDIKVFSLDQGHLVATL